MPDDPACPTVCFAEKPKQLIGETRVPCPTMPGQSARYDDEYERNGTCNLFMFFEPLRAWRHVDITDCRTGNDWAYAMKDLLDVYFPDAERIRLVMDNVSHRHQSVVSTAAPVQGNAPCNCSGPDLNLNCPDFKTQAGAQACWNCWCD